MKIFEWPKGGECKKFWVAQSRGVWSFSHLRFSYAKKKQIKNKIEKLFKFYHKERANYFDFYTICHMYAVVRKKALSNGFSFLSEFFFLDLLKSCRAFKNNRIELLMTLYWSIWKTKTKCLVFGVWFPVELLLVILLIYYFECYRQLGWLVLALS